MRRPIETFLWLLAFGIVALALGFGQMWLEGAGR
jgi:hypothetical protein